MIGAYENFNVTLYYAIFFFSEYLMYRELMKCLAVIHLGHKLNFRAIPISTGRACVGEILGGLYP